MNDEDVVKMVNAQGWGIEISEIARIAGCSFSAARTACNRLADEDKIKLVIDSTLKNAVYAIKVRR